MVVMAARIFLLAVGIACFAQVTPTFAQNGGGGAIAEWAKLGLLGAVMAWLLLVHLPNKDKQIKELLESHASQLAAKDAQIKDILEKKWLAIEKLSSDHSATTSKISGDFKEVLTENIKAILDHNKDEIASIRGDFREDVGSLREVLGEIKEVMANCRLSSKSADSS